VLIDCNSIDSGRRFDCDVCIVGAGPAGIAIADRLRTSGLSIILVESGGLNFELPTQNLYHGEIQGDPYSRLDGCRWRLLGGSTNRWGGWCRPLEAADYERREWIPGSGWPIGAEHLRPYESDAAKLFELPNANFALADWRGDLPEPFDLTGSAFESVVFQHSPETNFGEVYRSRLIESDRVTMLLHANLLRMSLHPGSARIGSLRLATLTGRWFDCQPRITVLAAGAIENARLLLASRDDRASGLGNEHDLVGRYFMEHLHVPVGHLLTRAGVKSMDFFRKKRFTQSHLRGVIATTAAARRAHKLLGTSIAFEPRSYALGTPFVGWPPSVMFLPVRAYKRLRAWGLSRTAERLKQVAQRLHSAPNRLRTWVLASRARARLPVVDPRATIHSLYFRAEQAPDRSNRVVLGRDSDALGVPRSRLEWRAQPMDIANINGWLAILDREWRDSGRGQVIAPEPDWQARITGGPHHMGTTRMSASPSLGVVDADCRVHSIDNLYVAGSSVFATGGYANPTFTIALLALRLADTLQARLCRTDQIYSTDPADLAVPLPVSTAVG